VIVFELKINDLNNFQIGIRCFFVLQSNPEEWFCSMTGMVVVLLLIKK